MIKGLLRPVAMACALGMISGGTALAQVQGASLSAEESSLLQLAQVQTDPKLVALQTAIDTKDTTSIAALLATMPRNSADRRTAARMLLAAAIQQRNAPGGDKAWAGALAAMALASGALGNEQRLALNVIRSTPGGLAVIASILNITPTNQNNLTVGTLVSQLVIIENPNQTHGSPS